MDVLHSPLDSRSLVRSSPGLFDHVPEEIANALEAVDRGAYSTPVAAAPAARLAGAVGCSAAAAIPHVGVSCWRLFGMEIELPESVGSFGWALKML
jgi:hypothetical protein